MALSAIISALFAGIVALITIKTGGILIGLAVFFGLFLFLSGGSFAFLSTLVIPTIVWIAIIFIIFYLIIKKKK